ncbi:MAG: arginine N-succinyltransferase [Alphaproteobacteria bacterium]
MPTDPVSGSENLVIRPSSPSDIEDFYELATLAGAGFTSLPANEAVLAERLSASARAFEGEPGVLMLVLEDRSQRRVVGCAAVKPGGTPRPDFLNFSITDSALTPTSRYADMTEVGSLLLHPDYRKSGIGPWLAKSRYLLIATDLERFGGNIFSELRGVVDADDRSPFYDAVCAPYFGCSFAEADDRCAHGRQGELNALLPAHPIPLESLPPSASAAMAQPHQAGRRALDYLDQEGFRFEGVVDLLDGGPAVVAETRSIGTISQSFEALLQPCDIDDEISAEAYIAVGIGPDFRCWRAGVSLGHDGEVRCPPDVLEPPSSQDTSTARVRLVDDRAQSLAQCGDAVARQEGLLVG